MQTMRGGVTLRRLPQGHSHVQYQVQPTKTLDHAYALQTSQDAAASARAKFKEDSCTPQDVRLLPVTMAEQPYSCCTLIHNHQ
jgi:hypothetical protein